MYKIGCIKFYGLKFVKKSKQIWNSCSRFSIIYNPTFSRFGFSLKLRHGPTGTICCETLLGNVLV